MSNPMKQKEKKVKAWADVGSGGGIFVFEAGPVASRYPRLMHIFDRQITSGLIPVTITYKLPVTKKKI